MRVFHTRTKGKRLDNKSFSAAPLSPHALPSRSPLTLSPHALPSLPYSPASTSKRQKPWFIIKQRIPSHTELHHQRTEACRSVHYLVSGVPSDTLPWGEIDTPQSSKHQSVFIYRPILTSLISFIESQNILISPEIIYMLAIRHPWHLLVHTNPTKAFTQLHLSDHLKGIVLING